MNLFKEKDLFFGPEIREIESLPEQLIYITDHIGHDDDISAWQHLEQLILQRPATAQPVLLEYISSYELSTEAASKCIFLPFQPYYTSWCIAKLHPVQQWPEKTSAFNFMINKTRGNRQLLLRKLSERNLNTDQYSLTWNSPHLLHGFKPRYFDVPGTKRIGDCIANRDWTNPQLYDHWLRNNVFEHSMVSLITEPAWQCKSAFISEKTIFAFEAGTIPIWIGGWRIEDHLKKLGFFTFDDIIDHSYQDIPDPVERCKAAIDLNYHILSNFDRLKEYWTEHRQFFEYNWTLSRSGDWFYQLLDTQLKEKQLSVTNIQKITVDLMFNWNYEMSQQSLPRI